MAGQDACGMLWLQGNAEAECVELWSAVFDEQIVEVVVEK